MLDYTQQRIAEFPDACRRAGLKVTPQRSVIFAMLASTDVHPTPEEVYSEIRKSSPSISLATVYKILDLFHARGFIRRVSTRDQVARYDARTERHYHAVCKRCGAIEDVRAEAAPPLPQGDLAGGFDVHDVDVVLRGLCHHCRTTGA